MHTQVCLYPPTLLYPTHPHTHYCTSTHCLVHAHRGSQLALRELQCRDHQRWRQSGCTCEERTGIENSNDANAKEILFEHLMCNADTADTLRMYCKIDVNGLPNMQKLGRKMLDELAPGVYVLACTASPLHACCWHQNRVRMYVSLSPLFGQSITGLCKSSSSHAVLPIHQNI